MLTPINFLALLLLFSFECALSHRADAQDYNIPQQAKDSCKMIANMNYDEFHDPVLAQAEYDNCLWPYIKMQMDRGVGEVQEMMRPNYETGGFQGQSPQHSLQGAPQQLQQNSPALIPFDVNNPLEGLPILGPDDPRLTRDPHNSGGSGYGSHGNDNDDRSKVRDCYSNCDEAERNCNKVNRFFSKPEGSSECAAERRSCDARCR